MEHTAAVAALKSLGLAEPKQILSAVEDGTTSLQHADSGSSIALLRRGQKYDILVLGAESECPVPSLRAILETAVLPLSDEYAANIGVAIPERDAVRKRIREASVALDVIARGRNHSVAPPDLPLHPTIREHVDAGLTSVDDLPATVLNDLALLNQLQSNVVSWSREIDRIVQLSRTGPDAVLSVEEETVFWSSLDAALSTLQQKLAASSVYVTLDILARKRRATGFLVDAKNSVEAAQRRASGVLQLIQGLPVVALRTAEDLPTLRTAVSDLLEHVSAKLRVSAFSIERVLSLVESMGGEVSRSIGRILAGRGSILVIPFEEFVEIFQSCCSLFEAWANGFDHCRKVARESARAKGEAMPSRRRSPLSHLHSHLANLYELRSGHQDLQALFNELLPTAPSSKHFLEELDSAFALLVEDCESFDHFGVRPQDESDWERISRGYRNRTSSIEEATATLYEEFVNNGTSVTNLCGSLRPFRGILEKPFIAQSITNVIPAVLNLGRRDYATLQNREYWLKRDKLSNRTGSVPTFFSMLSEYRLLETRAKRLLNNIERMIGKTQTELSPEVLGFVADVDKLRLRVNPLTHVSERLNRTRTSSAKSRLFELTPYDTKTSHFGTTLDMETASFFKVFRLLRSDQQLRTLVSPKHQEFSRFTRRIFPAFCNISEALHSYNTSCEVLRLLEDGIYKRVVLVLEGKQDRAYEVLEEGSKLTWDQPLTKLEAYSAVLRQRCGELEAAIQAVVEKDQLFASAMENLDSLCPRFVDGKLCDETKSELQRITKGFNAGIASLRHSFGHFDADLFARNHWVPRLTSALSRFLDRLTSFWVVALKAHDLALPTFVIDVAEESSQHGELRCTPSIHEGQKMLYKSIGDVYLCFLAVLNEGGEEKHSTATSTGFHASEILSHFFSKYSLSAHPRGFLTASIAAHEACGLLEAKVERWRHVVRKLALTTGERDDADMEAAAGTAVLSDLCTTYEAVTELYREDEGIAGTLCPTVSILVVDTFALFQRVSSSLLRKIRRWACKVSSEAADASQDLYRKVSDAKDIVIAASNADGLSALAVLQSVKDDVLPSCENGINAVSRVEQELATIAHRIKDSSLSPARIADTWILQNELIAHFNSLQSLYYQRRGSVLVNQELLLARYEDNRERYRQELTSVFSSFERIRSDEYQERDLFDSTSALDSLEKDLQKLVSEALELERVGKALDASHVPEHNGPENILVELQKVRGGIEKLCCVEEKVAVLSREKIRRLDPSIVQRSLTEWVGEIADIANLSGARREAVYLRDKLGSHMQASSFLKGLHSVHLSPPRERDLMRRLFGESYPKGGIADITLDMFWHADISAHAKYLRNVFENAAGEAAICDFLKGVEQTWACRKCTFEVHNGTAVLQAISALIDELEEHLQGLETLAASQHARLFESDRTAWEQRLSKCRDSLILLTEVQSRWGHLGMLFGTRGPAGISSLRSELHLEFTAFSNVHARFAGLGERLQNAPGLVEGLEGSLGLSEMKDELDGIVRGLSTFLEKQRSNFPRFFFLSDNDLLHVLSISAESIENLMPHIGKLFPGLSGFEITRKHSETLISNVFSNDGEVLCLVEPVVVRPRERISSWLRLLELQVANALKATLAPAIKSFGSKYKISSSSTQGSLLDVCIGFPSQVSFLATKICFARAVEECLLISSEASERLAQLSEVILGCLHDICSRSSAPGEFQNLGRKYLSSRDQLIKELVYQRDIVLALRNRNVTSILSHVWQHELRCYQVSSNANSRELQNVVFRCGKGEFSYGWEYLGSGETLVHTNLTSRCFLILTEALRRGFGGSPFGPAGTGKTETVKALGRVLGRFVAVFNCDESFDSVSVGRILAGACRVGSWVCFDEFNRLSSSILSTTSGQLASMQAAIKQGENVVQNFYGGDIPIAIKEGVGVFVTTNPTYSGRRQLPTNLKSLFRPCAMPRPDSTVIIEVLMLSQGFKSSSKLAMQLVSLFRYLQASLQARPHYDFGLRSLKSTVLAAGRLFAAYQQAMSATEAVEEDIMIRALGEVLKPKLEGSDILAYRCAVSTTFTEATCLSPRLPGEIEEVLSEVMLERNLCQGTIVTDKIRELYSLLEHQSGIILVGATGSGKSVAWRTLFEALKRRLSRPDADAARSGKRMCKSSLTVLDPKLLTPKQLYGQLDAVTREWSDGVFTKVLRGISEASFGHTKEVEPALHWIVFDGDVDPDWAESLNSVLDDNRILTLPNGEQIPLLSNTRILFETSHLKHANPSTVSRCGMICFGDIPTRELQEIYVSSVIKTVLDICPRCPLPTCLKEVAAFSVEVAEQLLKEEILIMQVPIWSLLGSALQHLRLSLLKLVSSSQRSGENGQNASSDEDEEIHISSEKVVQILLVVSVSGLSAGLTRIGQHEVAKKILKRFETLQDVQKALLGVDEHGSLADQSLSSDGCYQNFAELVSRERDDFDSEDIASPEVVVQTPTTVRLESLICDAISLNDMRWRKIRPLILCGPPGCGKSMMISAALRDVPNMSLATLSFSSETSPRNIVAALQGHSVISKRSNGTYCLHPKATGCRVVLFCDEVNLQKPDLYGSQSSLSFLRSLSEHGGFWHGSPPNWISVEGIQVVAACNPEEDSGRHVIPSRLLKVCQVARVELPGSEDLKIIYGAFVSALLREVHPGLASKRESLTAAMVEFYTVNKNRFCPEEAGPAEAHYIYSPRELSRWIRGMKTLLNIGSMVTHTFEQSKSDSLVNSLWDSVVSSFCYEARRLFFDRLLTRDERQFAERCLSEILETYLRPGCLIDTEEMYSSWLSDLDDEGTVRRRFELVRDPKKFRELIYQRLRVFAEEQGLGGSWMGGSLSDGPEDSSTMLDQFAVTDDVLTHLTRIERILCQSLGHAVLMGASGTGKKTLARFAAWMLSIEVRQIHSHSSYTEEDFASDLRSILRQAGVAGCQIMMIFDESNAMESSFLEMMNSVLACGEVPGLFSGEEKMRLLDDLRNKRAGNTSTTTEQLLYAEFVRRVRKNLHIVFTISTGCTGRTSDSAVESTIRAGGDISERSPALYNRCTVDWIGDWSRATLEAVAELKIEVALGAEKDQIIHSAVEMHEISRRYSKHFAIPIEVTPRHYLEFIEQINRIALEKGNEIQDGAYRHTEGLRRLEIAGNAVDDVKDALCDKSDHLQNKEVLANETLEKMVEEQRRAEKSKVHAEQLALAAEDASFRVREREEEVAAQLAGVRPKIDAAREAVKSIRKEFLEELRAMPNPPSAVRLALEGVLMLLDGTVRRAEGKYSWGSIRSRMRGSEFIASVVNFNVDLVPKGLKARFERQILSNPDFDAEKISYASRAAGPLAKWTLAVLDYTAVKEGVEPLEEEVRLLQLEQGELTEKQDRALQDVAILQEKIGKCRARYASLVSESERIRQDIQDSERSLCRAEEMLSSLGDEFNRWLSELKSFNEAAVNVWGNAVYGAALVAYGGSMDHFSRNVVAREWRQTLLDNDIQFDKDIRLCDFLTSAEERCAWSANNLPTDETSLENYAILKRSARFPLIVDPSRSSCELLEKVIRTQSSTAHKQTGNGLQSPRISKASFSVTTGKKSYVRALESSMRFGTSLVLEDAEKFDRAVVPLLGQEASYGDSSELVQVEAPTSQLGLISRSSGKLKGAVCRRVVRLGDKDVFLSPRFRLYLSTANIRLVPTPAITRSNVVSFELSPAALKSSCISKAMHIIAPELEEKRKELLSAKLDNQKRKRLLEKEVLSAITDVEDLETEILGGSLLDNLSSLKKEVGMLEAREEEEARSSKEVSHVEFALMPLGATAIDAFTALQSLSELSPLYVFHSSFFLRVFESAVTECKEASGRDLEAMVVEHQKAIISNTYTRVASSLFPKDRVPFAASLALVSFAHENIYDGEEVPELDMVRARALMHDILCCSEGRKGTIDAEVTTWEQSLPGSLKAKVRLLSTDNSPHVSSPMVGALRVLHQMLQAPHCLSQSIDELACTLPGHRGLVHGTKTESEHVLRHALLRVSEVRVHVSGSSACEFAPLFLYSRGETSDPATRTIELAQQFDIPVNSIAMGSTRTSDTVTKAVSHAIDTSAQGGPIVLLFKNMHLATKRASEQLQSEIMKRGRLLPCLVVIAAEVLHPSLCSSLLEFTTLSHSLAFETPPSFRASFSSSGQKVWAWRQQNPIQWPFSLLKEDVVAVALCWLHATLLERALHSPVGFTLPYEFSDSDLIGAWAVVASRATEGISEQEYLSGLREMLISTIYGCRTENDTDLDIISALVCKLFASGPLLRGRNGSLTVLEEKAEKETLTVPTDREEMVAYLRSMPEEAPPEWSLMPPDANRKRQTSEGRQALGKVLQLSEDKFFGLEGRGNGFVIGNQKTISPAKREDNLDYITTFGVEIDGLRPRQVSTENSPSRPWKCYLEAECNILSTILESLSRDVKCLSPGNLHAVKRTARLVQLKEELTGTAPEDSKTTPQAWFEVCPYFGRQISIMQFLSSVRDSSHVLKELQRSHENVNLCAVLRPAALLDALRFEAAYRRGSSPSSLVMCASGEPSVFPGASLLKALYSNGLYWDEASCVFKRCHGQSARSTLACSWVTECELERRCQATIEVQLYGRGPKASSLATVRIPVDGSVSREEWRLFSSSFSLSER